MENLINNQNDNNNNNNNNYNFSFEMYYSKIPKSPPKLIVTQSYITSRI
jgi:hypothetical protein